MKRLFLVCVAFLYGLGHRFPDGAGLGAIRVPPSQPILLAGRADNFLRVLVYAAVVVYFRGIFFLGFRIAAEEQDRIQLIPPDNPVKNFGAAGL